MKFDKSITNHAGLRYLNHPLEERYITRPDKIILPGMLPPEEFEVRNAMLVAKDEGTPHAQKVALDLITSTPEHKAAYRRVVNAYVNTNEYDLNLINKTENYKNSHTFKLQDWLEIMMPSIIGVAIVILCLALISLPVYFLTKSLA